MGRRLLIILGASAALAGATTGPAAAGGSITPLHDRVNPIDHAVAGPAFAGDAIAYAVPAGRAGYSVRVQQPDGSTSSQVVAAKGGGPIGDWDSVADELAASPQ